MNSSCLPEMKSLKTLASDVEYPNGNRLLHQFVVDYSTPNNSNFRKKIIHATLLSFSGLNPNAINREGLTALHLAVRKKNYPMVRKLISCLPKIDVNARSQVTQRTALHLAISLLGLTKPSAETTIQEVTNIIEFLISSGADLNTRDRDGATPLHEAARNDNLEIVNLLVENGSDVESSLISGVSPLFVAVQQNQTDVVQFLISRGANVNKRKSSGDTPLHIAFEACCWERAKVLVERSQDDDELSLLSSAANCVVMLDLMFRIVSCSVQSNIVDVCGSVSVPGGWEAKWLETVKVLVEGGADVNCRNREGDTPLHVALKLKQIEAVKFLIKSGANPNALDRLGKVPLHCAMETLDVGVVKALVQSKAVLNPMLLDVRDENYDTPLHKAVKLEQTDIVIFLIESGADLNALGEIHNSPLHTAVETGSLETVRALVERGAIVDSINFLHNTPLHLAVLRRRIEIAEFLINSGAYVNAFGEDLYTPLHMAVRAVSVEMVKILVRGGAVVDARNMRGDAPLHVAAEFHQVEMVKCLVDHGADVNARGERGKTPLCYAVQCLTRCNRRKKGSKCMEVVKFLVERGALSQCEGRHYEPIELASLREEIEISRLLSSRWQ